jgi:hypothetical protein
MADGVEETPAIPGLPNHLVVAHILRSDFLRDPADLAVLRRVSRGMRDAVDATGRKIEELREDDAAERGYLSTLKCLRRQGRLCNNRLLCAAAARSGDLDELKSFRAEEISWDKRTCAYAAERGDLEMLQWARDHDCPWSEYTCEFAAERGDLVILKWARENGCSLGRKELMCEYAAKGGHFEVLKWARENGCPWDGRTCYLAAEGGYLEVLKWARDNDCPWDEETCARAVYRGHLEVLKWAHANGCPLSHSTRLDLISMENRRGFQSEVVRWLEPIVGG